MDPNRPIDTPELIDDAASVRAILTSPDYLPDPTFRGTIRYNPDMPGLLGITGTEHSARRRDVSGPFLPNQVDKWSSIFAAIARDCMPENKVQVLTASDYARPVAVESALRFVGLDTQHSGAISGLAKDFFACEPPPSSARRAILAVRLSRLLKVLRDRTDDSGSCPIDQTDAPDFSAMMMGSGEYGLAAAITTLFGIELITRGILGCLWYIISETGIGIDSVDRSIIDKSIIQSKLMNEVYRRRRAAGGSSDPDHLITEEVLISLCPVEPGLSASSQHKFMPFGYGPHYCLGANLVRAIIAGACNEFLRKFCPIAVLSCKREDGAIGRPGGVVELTISVRSRSSAV